MHGGHVLLYGRRRRRRTTSSITSRSSSTDYQHPATARGGRQGPGRDQPGAVPRAAQGAWISQHRRESGRAVQFHHGIANETRTKASINQANKFASNVLGDTVVAEMTKSEPPELAPGSTSSVRGNEKKPPHGRGCVTIQEPSAKHKLRRTLALHAGLRKCAAATTRDPDQAPPQPPLARPPVAHQSRAGSSTGRWRAARRLTS